MNSQRILVLGLALVAAVGAAFLVRGFLGGGTPQVQAKLAPPPIAMSEVLVANANLQPGEALSPDQVRWEKWPTSAVDSSFITHANVASQEEAVKGTVVRQPIMAGQPIAANDIVHGDASGLMAALLTSGMRAMSIVVSADNTAGGFILPNDRIDIILTRKFDGQPPRVVSKTILSNVRVLAVDQTVKQEKDTKTVIGKTATVEVTPEQGELLSSAQTAGTLSLALRALGDNEAVASLSDLARKKHALGGNEPTSVTVYRYGMVASSAKPDAQQEKPQ